MKLRNKNTGDIGRLEVFDTETICVLATKKPYVYHSLAELNEEWEDYKPPMPKIKDGNICKIVRDWYEYNRTDSNLPIYCEDGCTLSINHSARIEFQAPIFRNLEQDYAYNINELCGEEEDA